MTGWLKAVRKKKDDPSWADCDKRIVTRYVNLDRAQGVAVKRVIVEDDTSLKSPRPIKDRYFVVVAIFPESPDVILLEGLKKDCEAFIDRLMYPYVD
jgi:hypothetical protein